MKIVMLTMEAGPENIFRPGDVRDVDEETAELMIAKGFAKQFMEAAIEHKAEKREKAVATPAIQVSRGKKRGVK